MRNDKLLERAAMVEQGLTDYLNQNHDCKLVWVGEENKSWDIEGYNSKGQRMAIEVKYRNKYYKTKFLEVYKYKKLMELKDTIVLYIVKDPEGTYIYHLNNLEMPSVSKIPMGKTTGFEDRRKVYKKVYCLTERKAFKFI